MKIEELFAKKVRQRLVVIIDETGAVSNLAMTNVRTPLGLFSFLLIPYCARIDNNRREY